MASSDQKASPGVYVTPDVGLEVTDGTYSRVQVGKITTAPTYGIKVLSSDGTTVIIDGTSDVFKISASGTLSVTEATGNGNNATVVTLTALGAGFTAAPAHLSFVSNVSSGGPNYPGTIINPSAGFVAANSGGSPTTLTTTMVYESRIITSVSAGQATVEIKLFNQTSGSITTFGKYFTFAELAL